MTNLSSPGGWRDRLKKTREIQAARADAAGIRAERQAMYDAEAEASRWQAEQANEAMKATLCACPVCDTGNVTVVSQEVV